MDKENGNWKRSTKGKVTIEGKSLWEGQGAREKTKRKSYRGIITVVKLGTKGTKKGEEEGCMERKVHIGNKWWKIMVIYSKEIKTRRGVEDAMKENREDRISLEGDFKGRIGERGARNWGGEGGWKKKIQRQGGKCRGEENGSEVLNENKQADEEGEWTYIGSRGETVTDYGIVNEEAWERVEDFRIGEKVESDHLEIALRKNREGKRWG
jgi:hypothetical protein